MPRRAIYVSVLGLFLAMSASAAAQEPVSQTNAKASANAAAPADVAGAKSGLSPADPAAAVPGDVWLPLQDGKLVPVPLDATMQEFLQWLKDRNKPSVALPAFDMTLTFEGTANDDDAFLTAKVLVQVQRDNEWVRVPLRMEEAVLLPGAKHSGAGEGVPAVAGRAAAAEPGHAWHLKGRGLHELTLPIVVPLRKQPGRRLELTLPETTANSLKLRIAGGTIRVAPLESSVLRTRSAGEAGTDVEVIGLHRRLDLRWMPQSESEVSLLTSTSIRLSLTRDGESVLLKANQKIQARKGSYQRIKVQMPSGFELQNGFEVQNGQPRLEGRQYGREDVDSNHRVTVELPEPTEGLTELQWELEAPFPANGQMVLSGFAVEQARQQVGDVAISSVDGYRVQRLGGESIRRVNVSEVADRVQVDSAYKFNQQPFRLDLRIEEIEPQFTVEPKYYLHLTSDSIEFTADLGYTVQLGAVHDVELKWPGWRAEGWQSVRALSADGKSQDVEYLGESGNESVKIRVFDPSQREFRQILRARRELPKDRKSVTFSLPRVVATSPRPPILIVADAENVESTVSPLDGTLVRVLPSGRRNDVDLPEELRTLSRNELQIESPAARFSANVAVRQRLIRAESIAKAALIENRVRIEQRMRYDVRFEAAAEIGLLAPKSLQRRVVFAMQPDGGEEIPLTPNWTPQERGNAEKARFTLQEARTGRFTVIARYDVPLPEDAAGRKESTVAVPLIQSADARLSPVRVAIANSGETDISISDANWVLEPPRPGEPETTWMSIGDSETEAVTLRLSTSSQDLLQDFSIRRARIRTSLQPDGSLRVRAQYRIEGAVSKIDLALPAGSVVPGFWWDAAKLESKPQITSDVTLRGYALQVSKEVERGSHLLTVEYAMSSEGPIGWFAGVDAAAPRFPPAVWTEELAWEIVLPFDHYLWNYPEGFIPQFAWKRQTMTWERIPMAPYDDPAAWINAADGPADLLDINGGNSYVFSRSAPATAVRIASLNQSMVLLIGAGLALGAGFLLLKMPVLQSVLTPLLVAFVVSILWVVAAAPVQLLLQPALFGLGLAALAAFIDRKFSGKRAPVYMALPPASDFASPLPAARSSAAPSSSVDRPVLLGAGSDDPTAMRPANEELAESLSSSDSGSRR